MSTGLPPALLVILFSELLLIGQHPVLLGEPVYLRLKGPLHLL